MANPVKGETPLYLSDGRQLTLVLDFAARVAMEETLDMSFMQVAERASSGWQSAIRALFWGSLQRHHPEISLAEAGEILDTDLNTVMAAITEAGQRAAQPEDAGNGIKGPPRPRGKTSGAAGVK